MDTGPHLLVSCLANCGENTHYPCANPRNSLGDQSPIRSTIMSYNWKVRSWQSEKLIRPGSYKRSKAASLSSIYCSQLLFRCVSFVRLFQIIGNRLDWGTEATLVRDQCMPVHMWALEWAWNPSGTVQNRNKSWGFGAFRAVYLLSLTRASPHLRLYLVN